MGSLHVGQRGWRFISIALDGDLRTTASILDAGMQNSGFRGGHDPSRYQEPMVLYLSTVYTTTHISSHHVNLAKAPVRHIEIFITKFTGPKRVNAFPKLTAFSPICSKRLPLTDHDWPGHPSNGKQSQWAISR